MDASRFAVLHALSIKGTARLDAIAAVLACDPDDALGELDGLRRDGLAVHLERRDSWRLTPQGRDRHAALLEDDTAGAVRQRMYPGYERFLPLNLRFKDMCTRWQIRHGQPNDHTDPRYDQAIVAELGELHAQARPVIADLARQRDRFGRYANRLDDALGRLRAGEPNAFTGVLCGSYHDVWMELHRDLLLSLRVDRADEEARHAAAGVGR